MDYANYSDNIYFMPTSEACYPELNNISAAHGQFMAAPQRDYHQDYHAMNIGDGHHRYTPGQPVSTSASAYRAMARQKKRTREIQSRNGLHTPMDANPNYRVGEIEAGFPCFANYSSGFGFGGATHARNSHW